MRLKKSIQMVSAYAKMANALAEPARLTKSTGRRPKRSETLPQSGAGAVAILLEGRRLGCLPAPGSV